MDFSKLAKAIPAASTPPNGTAESLAPNILEALIPGYGPISRYVLATAGLDISIFVFAALFAVGGSKAWTYIYDRVSRSFRSNFTSSVYIDQHDDLFDMVMAWIAANQASSSRRNVRAKTQHGSESDKALDIAASDALDENGMFNYNEWNARTSPRYEPYYGWHLVWHNGTPFFLSRYQKPAEGKVSVSWGYSGDDDMLEVINIGRNTEPTKAFLKTVKRAALHKLIGSTTVRHPTPKERARHGGAWSKTTSRPSRPMETVILDAEQKTGIIRDMNEYLHPASPRWYATRGIPYRRGYLFHGPPGTGKTSLSFALAGIFGLDIYAISLQEPTLTEGDLMMLFNGLPRRCIVLLEDVDAAGLLRDGQSGDGDDGKNKKKKKVRSDKKDQEMEGGEKKTGKGLSTTDAKESSAITTNGEDRSTTDAKESPAKSADSEYTLRDLARELKAIGASKGGGRGGGKGSISDNSNRAPGTGISLSGLLNAIDGVATHEGRVLIMTTNHPEKLDAALVRPGRVDRRVGFKLALQDQIRELFVRMYSTNDVISDVQAKINGVSARSAGVLNGNGHLKEQSQLAALSANEIAELALEFAGHVPDDTFTPAEIQNHLMRYKKEPRTAVDTADAWVKETLAEKEETKVEEDDDDDE